MIIIMKKKNSQDYKLKTAQQIQQQTQLEVKLLKVVKIIIV